MEKIIIIGCGGAGKSTLAKKLHLQTGLPLVHLDQCYFTANWVAMENSKWTAFIQNAVEEDRWIMDGNYGGTMDIRLQRADTIIFLDRPTWVCVIRVLKRVWQNYGTTREDMAEGCPERFSWEFIHYILRYYSTRRPAILRKLEEWKKYKKVIILKNDQEMDDYLETIKP